MVYCYKFYQKVNKYPRGPRPLPFIGNCHQIDFINFQEWIEEQSIIFGPMFTIFTPTPTIILMNYELIKECFLEKQSETCGRPLRNPKVLISMSPNSGITSSNGECWLEQRKGSLYLIRQLILKTNKIEKSITLGIQDFLKHIEQSKNKSNIDITYITKLFVSNTLHDILFNYRYPPINNKPFKNFINNIELAEEKLENYKTYIISQLIPFYPYLYHVIFAFTGQLVFKVNQMFRFIKDEVSKSKVLFNDNEKSKSFCEEYLKRIEIMKYQNTSYTLDNLESTTLNLFSSGYGTTNELIKCCFYCLSDNQHIQKEMRKEINNLEEKNSLVTIKDILNLPYCNSVVYELLRYISIQPITYPHTTTKEITLNNFTIPGGTVIIGNLYNIHRNDKSFLHGDILIPDRFISPDTGKINKQLLEKLIPFGIGARKCIGEEIIIMELFLLLTNIVKYYNIKKIDNYVIDTLQYQFNSVAKINSSKFKFENIHI
ncbi:Cytochrome P450 18a1 [Strongyloides ratti]|uniref:Cytochrome P450 18a1 n=1 Tax=Strongyloides ratti TaxID=34506 RepID=A0A090LKX3_STRRB|nr:Cytochrome P450 18a1 [Strongyloides ratti]CEF70479.1 Cytochrome P450 18a1 [Strongyloides ratti]